MISLTLIEIGFSLFNSWYVGDWESCSASCGSGLQYRAVYCQQIAVGSTPITVNNSECENTIGPRPTHLRPCSTDMPCPQWNSGPWSSCDKLCGIGERTRFITCQRTVNDTIEVFPDAACKDSPKPENKEKCDKGPCEGVDWIVSPWSGVRF